jgi:chromosomal replication initiator protein
MRKETEVIKEAEEAWLKCLNVIEQNIDPGHFKTWFKPTRAVKLEQSVLTIQVPDRIFYEFIEEHHVNVLRPAIRQILGAEGKLEYRILQAPAQRNSNIVSGSGIVTTPTLGEDVKNRIKNPFAIPGIQRIKVNPQINPKYTFDNYVEGDCNRLARSAGIAVAKRPGETAFNPLFIYGETGLGKTHLIQAIGNFILNTKKDKTVLYVSANDFTNQFIEALRNNATNDFVNFYQQIDTLIVDDIHFLKNRVKTQDIFFHVFNQLHQSGRQLILTSDVAPKDLNGMEERLISRFKWGLSADLQIPDFETRMAIIKEKAAQNGLELPSDIAEFISVQVSENIRGLEGAVNLLLAHSSLNGRQIDLPLAQSIVSKIVHNLAKEITVDHIIKLVADHFNLDINSIQGKTRKRSVVIARQLSMYLAKNLTSQSLKSIGENFGGRDHATVIHSCKAVQNMLDTDNTFKKIVFDLEKRIKSGTVV